MILLWLLSAGLWPFLRAVQAFTQLHRGRTSLSFPQPGTHMLLWPRPCKHPYPCYGGFPREMVSTSARITSSFPLFLLLHYSFSLQYRKNTTWGDDWNRPPFFLCFPFLDTACCCSLLTRLLPCPALNYYFKGLEWALTL